MYRDAYLESEVLSASPMKLVELLYRGAIDAAGKACEALQKNDVATRNRNLGRAQAIITELGVSLDRARGGKLSKDLVELYDYMQRRLNEANIAQSAAPILEVKGLLVTLLEGWSSISPEQALDDPAGQYAASADDYVRTGNNHAG